MTSSTAFSTTTPASPAASCSRSALSWERTVPTTLKPSRARCNAVSSPTPELVPVTRTVLTIVGRLPTPGEGDAAAPRATPAATLALGVELVHLVGDEGVTGELQ
ncbi:MAG: hypothetical protein KY447_00825 [Actinobacteria bacterium]|nr:hypothetical protein [Actinomycetota bacterium]